ncbi:uncharacterized protein LOC108275562 isoform X2 [Ictalurus punctatus]|uniref:Uncharacterized protein LOC108275562 isoform X2 n=1 Tax=Ictalurus punctatus TaxID=7998 RepID=A0A979F6H3_ICTPU|nr:uncharacterized protein LOC108275562 isoform X2 [Ictalurus punctatus]
MCHQFIPIICHRRRPQHTPRKVRNLDNLCSLNVASADSFSSSIGLWNCQSAVNKADFIPAFATHYNLSVLALTETWIHAENTATLAALASNFNFYHTSRPNRRGGGTGQLGKFIDEFDMLLSTIPNDGTPLLVLGDFNIHLDKPHAAYFLALLPTVDLKQFTTPAIPKADKQLNLTLTQQSPGHQAVWLQEQSLHRDCSAFRH